jgi:hypothetical protein
MLASKGEAALKRLSQGNKVSEEEQREYGKELA